MRDKKEPQMGSIKFHEGSRRQDIGGPFSDSNPIVQVAIELDKALAQYPPFASAHEGYAILLEEVDELKAEVWLKPEKRSKERMRKEAVQIAAMAARFILDMEGWK